MGASNVDRLMLFLPHSDMDTWNLSVIPHDHQCNSSSSSSSQTPNSNDYDDQTKIIEDENSVSSALKIQVPSSTGEFVVSYGEDDHPKTPTSTEHRIPVVATCPPAPRKTRWVPAAGKRKVPFFPVVRVAADFIVYMDAMLALNEAVYVPDIVVGDLGAGGRVKRLKLLPSPAHES